jgi:hypothetical protein
VGKVAGALQDGDLFQIEIGRNLKTKLSVRIADIKFGRE